LSQIAIKNKIEKLLIKQINYKKNTFESLANLCSEKVGLKQSKNKGGEK